MMLRLIPAPLHRMLYRVADRVRRRWWRIRKPHRSGVVVIALDETGRLLLARHSYGRPVWALPGGGIGRREEPVAAAMREFREELGCGITNLRPHTTTEESVSGARERQHVFVARLAGTPVPDMREVVEVRMFDPVDLPANLGRISARHIAEWGGREALEQR